jgi:hypothetical protein
VKGDDMWINCPKEGNKRRSALIVFNETKWEMEIVCKGCGGMFVEDGKGNLKYLRQYAVKRTVKKKRGN